MPSHQDQVNAARWSSLRCVRKPAVDVSAGNKIEQDSLSLSSSRCLCPRHETFSAVIWPLSLNAWPLLAGATFCTQCALWPADVHRIQKHHQVPPPFAQLVPALGQPKTVIKYVLDAEDEPSTSLKRKLAALGTSLLGLDAEAR